MTKQLSEQFAALLALAPDWDSYGAKAPDALTLRRARLFLEQHGGPEPWVVPMNDGGVQLEWHQNGQDLEIEFHPGKDDSASWEGSPSQAVKLLPGLSAPNQAEEQGK